jgi:hypothetical protein
MDPNEPERLLRPNVWYNNNIIAFLTAGFRSKTSMVDTPHQQHILSANL